MHEIWIVILSAIVPLSTLIYTMVGGKHKEETDYVTRLEHRLRACEHERERLWKVIRELQERRRRR